MSYRQILKLAQKFETSYQSLNDTNFQNEQQKMLGNFYENFYRKILNIINELNGDLTVLKERQFDDKMTKLLSKIHNDLIDIIKKTDPHKPYGGANQLIHFVLEKPNSSIIDNLDFLAKHHIANTNINIITGPVVGHPKITSLDHLKSLAKQLQDFINKNPISLGSIPSSKLQENMQNVPSFPSGNEDITNPGIPSAKKQKIF